MADLSGLLLVEVRFFYLEQSAIASTGGFPFILQDPSLDPERKDAKVGVIDMQLMA